MQGVTQEFPFSLTEIEVISAIIEKPHLDSYDSGDECSLEHWMEVYRLAHEEFLLAEIAAGEGSGWADDYWSI